MGGGKPSVFGKQTWTVVKGCDLEMISTTFSDLGCDLSGQSGGFKQCRIYAKTRFFCVSAVP